MYTVFALKAGLNLMQKLYIYIRTISWELEDLTL